MSRDTQPNPKIRIIVPDRQVDFIMRCLSFPKRRLLVQQRRPKEPIVNVSTVPDDQPEDLFVIPPLNQLDPTIALQNPAGIDQDEAILLEILDNQPKKQLALLLPAHNEELIIATTIRSAIIAGQPIEDIYVVNDNSSDNTRAIATDLLGKANVLNVSRSGKALACKKAIDKFKIESNYTWLHIADADSIFSQDYFRQYCSKLDPEKYAVAVGFVQSLRGNWISTYRALTYTYSQQVTRRFQSYLGMISVFPGPITCLRTDIISKLEFGGASLTEDFDITLQVHRKKLGKILYIPKAVNYTQDPQTLKDFCKQNFRWQRGFFQGVKKHKIGQRGQLIDVSLGIQILQTVMFLFELLVLLPIILVVTHNWIVIPVLIAADIIVNGVIALFASVAAKRWMLIGALPYFYFLRWVEIIIYIIAFFEVIILKRFQVETVGWSTADRRYKLTNQALLDVAK